MDTSVATHFRHLQPSRLVMLRSKSTELLVMHLDTSLCHQVATGGDMSLLFDYFCSTKSKYFKQVLSNATSACL